MSLYKITYSVINTKTEYVRADSREDAFRAADLIDWTVGSWDSEDEEVEVYLIDEDDSL